MIAYHESCEADITVGVVDVPIERANEFGIMTTDDTNRVMKFAEKPQKPDPIIGNEPFGTRLHGHLRDRAWNGSRSC